MSMCVYTDLGNLARVDVTGLGSDANPVYTVRVTLWPGDR